MRKANLNFECKVLDDSDAILLKNACDCLSETFAGVTVGKSFVCEPMAKICNLSKNDMMNFTTNYIKNIVNDGLCVIAIDKDTNRVIGAMAGENFTPLKKKFSLKVENNPINNIFGLLSDLDDEFVKVVESSSLKVFPKNQYVRGSMFGVRTEFSKKEIANEMLKLLVNQATSKGYDSIFVEATNIKSQKFSEMYGFYVAKDLTGKPISRKYSTHKVFNKIPNEIGSECLLMVKPLKNNIKIFK